MRRVLLAVLAITIVPIAPPQAAHAAPALPSVIASTGDSITRGFNACGWYVDCTSRSWSTGDSTSVNSHYLRIRAMNSGVNGHNVNAARSGAKMIDLNGQMGAVIASGAQYVTVLMGANDACTSTEAAMTPISTYRAQLDSALGTL
jgi:GDSL-like Lipase/Acylhydrolase